MATNLALDDELIRKAQELGHHKTKKDAVNFALADYIKRKSQLSILDSFGAVDFDSSYDYKANRTK